MAKNKYIYIAADANVLRMLAEVKEAMDNTADGIIPYIKDANTYKNFNHLKHMLELIKSDKLRVLVVNSVFNEVDYRKDTREFIKEYCYMQNLNQVTFDKKIIEQDRLALAYCTETYNYKNKEYFPPMPIKYNGFARRKTPDTDAYIVAEATVERCLLVTDNSKHMVYRKDYEKDTNLRAIGIGIINNRHGYGSVDEYGKIYDPRPMSLKDFGDLLEKKGVENFCVPKIEIEDFIKAEDVLRL